MQMLAGALLRRVFGLARLPMVRGVLNELVSALLGAEETHLAAKLGGPTLGFGFPLVNIHTAYRIATHNVPLEKKARAPLPQLLHLPPLSADAYPGIAAGPGRTLQSRSMPDDKAWDEELLKNPHAVADKRGRVQRMFSAIAPSYDLNNRLHSLGMDQAWRRYAVRLAKLSPTDVVADIACGTGDLALKFAAAGAEKVIGIDFTYAMLPLARAKDERSNGAGRISFVNGDAQALPLPDGSADVVSIAFGIRNVMDPAVAIREFQRVLRPGGRVIILEFSLPSNAILRWAYNLYFRHVLPRSATLISGDKTGAYKYLPESVNSFISRDTMMRMMAEAGFTQVEQFPMTFGVCVCYRGLKR